MTGLKDARVGLCALAVAMLSGCREPAGSGQGGTGTTGSGSTGGTTTTGAASGDETAAMPPLTVPDAAYGSGSRLRAIVLSLPSGEGVLAAFRDTELQIDCTFTLDGDGAYRCLPTAGTLQTALWPSLDRPSEDTGHLVAECDVPVLRAESCAYDPGDEVALPSAEACGTDPAPRVPYLVGSPLPDSDPCAQPIEEGEITYALTELPTDPYAVATVVDTPMTRALLSEDGAWVHVALLDDSGAPCAPSDAGCMPVPAAVQVESMFADADCSVPGGLGSNAEGCDFVPPYAFGSSDDEVWTVQTQVGQLRVVGDEGCTALDVPGYALGERVSASVLSEARWEHLGGPDVRARYASRNEDPQVAWGFWDAQFGAPCRIVENGALGLVCLRSSFPTPRRSSVFADSACTVPVYGTDNGGTFVLVEQPSAACPGRTTYAVHESESAPYPSYELDDDEQCIEAVSPWCGGSTCLVAGDKRPTSTVVTQLTRTIE